MEFTLKLIELLFDRAKAAEIAAQLVMSPGIYTFTDEGARE
jgi:4-methyl-5(b-hydroxyethyl)-thiazole monophosphate biosynthesis